MWISKVLCHQTTQISPQKSLRDEATTTTNVLKPHCNGLVTLKSIEICFVQYNPEQAYTDATFDLQTGHLHPFYIPFIFTPAANTPIWKPLKQANNMDQNSKLQTDRSLPALWNEVIQNPHTYQDIQAPPNTLPLTPNGPTPPRRIALRFVVVVVVSSSGQMKMFHISSRM